MSVRAIRYIASADGRSYAQVDTNGSRWRCLIRPYGEPQHIEYFDTVREALAALDRLRKGQS